MAQEKQSSPEKDLLKLIEKPMSNGSLRAATARYQGRSFFAADALRGRIAFFLNTLRSVGLGWFHPDIRMVNLLLVLVMVVLGGGLFMTITKSMEMLKKGVPPSSVAELSRGEQAVAVPSVLKDAEYYVGKATMRDLFNMVIKADAAGTVAQGPTQKMIDATEALKLVGISWSQNPDVMIEDTKTQRTMFLKEGQALENGMKLKKVFKDHVVLQLNAEEMELR
jgi:hypothetical protein